MLNIFGSNHEEIGSTDKNLIFKTQGKIRIQWGKKFIDLLDNDGNINCGLKNIISKVSSEDSIKKDGFYYLDGALIACVGGKKIIISSESGNTFVSFLVEQDATDKQKQLAQKNIGFYYDTKKDINITNGIAYVEDEGTLYIINNGNINKFTGSIPNPYPNQFVISKQDQSTGGSLVITGQGENNSLMFDTLSIFSDNGAVYRSNLHRFFVGNNLVCQINGDGVITESIQSENASASNGYRISNRGGKYTLEIDSIVVRDGLPSDINLVESTYYKSQNIISSVKKVDNQIYRCYLNKYNNKYHIGDKLLIYVNDEGALTPIILTVTGISSGEDQYVDVSSSTNIESVSGLLCQLIDYDLVIGKLNQQTYNSKEHGIISKQNLFYSAKFDKEGSGTQIYPFYSNELYSELENNIESNNYNNVIPPLGLIKSSMLVHDVEYDSNTKKINFYNYKGKLVCDLDATAFIKDGMVASARVSGKYLVIKFNTDAGKEDIRIPITDIFNPSDYYKRSEIDSMVGGSLPIGTILMWPGSAQKIPSGFAICDGSQFDTSANPTLYDILGSNRLPDLRDKFIVGAGHEYNIGDTGGEKTHTLSIGELPSHSHNYSSPGEDGWATNRVVDRTEKSCYGDSNYASSWKYKTETAGNGDAHENRPPYYALFYIIKANVVVPEGGCYTYEFTEMDYIFSRSGNIGSAVAKSTTSADALTFDQNASDSWIHLQTVQNSGGFYIYIIKPDDTTETYREGIAVFKSSDGCVFETIIKQGSEIPSTIGVTFNIKNKTSETIDCTCEIFWESMSNSFSFPITVNANGSKNFTKTDIDGTAAGKNIIAAYVQGDSIPGDSAPLTVISEDRKLANGKTIDMSYD